MKHITVTLHAIERFAERIMHLDPDIKMDQQQLDFIREQIYSSMSEYCPLAYEFGSGIYHIPDYNADLHIENSKVVTITPHGKGNRTLTQAPTEDDIYIYTKGEKRYRK